MKYDLNESLLTNTISESEERKIESYYSFSSSLLFFLLFSILQFFIIFEYFISFLIHSFSFSNVNDALLHNKCTSSINIFNVIRIMK